MVTNVLSTADFKRVLIWSVPAVILVTVLIVLLRPRTELVDVVEVTMQPMLVTIDEEGETRAREIFTISAPVGGRLLRTSLKEGDSVVANQTIVAEIEPSEPDFLDPRSQAESEAGRDAATAARDLASAELKQAEAERDYALAEVKRARELFQKGTVPRQRVDDTERAAQGTQALVEAAMASLSVRDFELRRAQARLITPSLTQAHRAPCDCVTLKSPVNGRVLRVLQKSETVVMPGTPLLEVGDASDLEIVADMLSVDAVKVRPNQKVIIDRWGGDKALNAIVRVVEPFAFTKVSALGIEEQRVNVVLDLVDPVVERAALGHAYRVIVRVVIWQSDGVKTIPLTSLFRLNDEWAVFVDDDGVAGTRKVTIGYTAGLDVEVLGGLEIGERVILHPNDRLKDGTRIRYR